MRCVVGSRARVGARVDVRRAASVRARSALRASDTPGQPGSAFGNHPAQPPPPPPPPQRPQGGHGTVVAKVVVPEAQATTPPVPPPLPPPTAPPAAPAAPPAFVAEPRSPEFDIDVTVATLEAIEKSSVEERRYDVAQRARVALWRLQEMREKLALCEEEEAEGVVERDYDKALRAGRGLARLLTEYKALKSRDYYSADGDDVDLASDLRFAAIASAVTLVPVRFTVQRETDFGAHVVVVGSCEELGCWNPEQGCLLQWSEKGWTGTAHLPAGERVRFKFCIRASLDVGANCTWQEGDDRTFEIPGQPAALSVDVSSDWDEGGMVWFCTSLETTPPDPDADAADAAGGDDLFY